MYKINAVLTDYMAMDMEIEPLCGSVELQREFESHGQKRTQNNEKIQGTIANNRPRTVKGSRNNRPGDNSPSGGDLQLRRP